MTFTFRGRDLDLFDHPYNTTSRNERAVEIPVAVDWLSGRDGPGLEVGNVLGHYLPVSWRVVDRYEQAAGVDNLDVFDITGRYRWIVAISTIEHVGRDGDEPRDPARAVRAIDHLRSLLAPGGGRMLLTVPLGYHPHLDEQLAAGAVAGIIWQSTVVRCGDGWEEHTESVERRPYGPWANAVWIGEFA